MGTTIKEIKAQNEARLLALPGVVSVGVGRTDAGEAAIVVGLSGPDLKTESALPAQMGGYPVVVRYVGPVKAQP